MKRFLIAPLLLILLTGCQSNREICARWSSDQISSKTAAKKLNIIDKGKYAGGLHTHLWRFCTHYGWENPYK